MHELVEETRQPAELPHGRAPADGDSIPTEMLGVRDDEQPHRARLAVPGSSGTDVGPPAFGLATKAAERFGVSRRAALPGFLALGAVAGALPHRLPPGLVAKQPENAASRRLRVFGGDDDAGLAVLDGFRQSGTAGDHGRQPAQRGLHHGDPVALHVAARSVAARHDKKVGRVEQARQAVRFDPAEQVHAVEHSELSSQLAQLLAAGRKARHDVVRPRLLAEDPGKRAHHDVLSLALGDVADRDQDARVGVLQAQLSPRVERRFRAESSEARGIRSVGNHRLVAGADPGFAHAPARELAHADDARGLLERPAQEAGRAASSTELGSVPDGDPGDAASPPAGRREQDRPASRSDEHVRPVAADPAREHGFSIHRLERRPGDRAQADDGKGLRRVEARDLVLARVILRRQDDGPPAGGVEAQRNLVGMRTDPSRPRRKLARQEKHVTHQLAVAARWPPS